MARECFVKADLTSVVYGGKDIGKEWEFKITFTPPGTTINIPLHQLSHGTTKTYNTNLVNQRVGAGTPGVQFRVQITAREHDWLVDDVASHHVLTPVYEYTDKPVTHTFSTEFLVTEHPIVIPHDGKLEFHFAITLRSAAP